MLGRGGILLCPRGFPAVTVRLKLRDGAAKSPCTCGLDSEIYIFEMVLLQFIQEANEESCDYVVREMEDFLKTDMPDVNVVRAYLLHPKCSTRLKTKEQLIAMDKMLEFAEVSFRTSCDLLRYRMMRDAGIVRSMDEFLELLN